MVALEVKLAAVAGDEAVRHLHWLREQVGDDLLDAAPAAHTRHCMDTGDPGPDHVIC